MQISELKPAAFQASLKTEAKGRGFQLVGGQLGLKAKRTGREPHVGDCVGRSRPIPAWRSTHLAPRGALGRNAPFGGSRGIETPELNKPYYNAPCFFALRRMSVVSRSLYDCFHGQEGRAAGRSGTGRSLRKGGGS